jgi:hypothetical protein
MSDQAESPHRRRQRFLHKSMDAEETALTSRDAKERRKWMELAAAYAAMAKRMPRG